MKIYGNGRFGTKNDWAGMNRDKIQISIHFEERKITIE